MNALRELLERALDVIRGELEAAVECSCNLTALDSGEIVPVPGTASPEGARDGEFLLTLVRDIEVVTGRPVEHENPQWLDDLIDRKWSLS